MLSIGMYENDTFLWIIDRFHKVELDKALLWVNFNHENVIV